MFSTPWASVLDCTATRVNAGTPHNMQVHANAVVGGLLRRASGRALLGEKTAAFLFVHGCGKTFRGQMGLRFVGRDADEFMDRLVRRANEQARAAGVGADAQAAEGAIADYALSDCPGRYTSAVRCRPRCMSPFLAAQLLGSAACPRRSCFSSRRYGETRSIILSLTRRRHARQNLQADIRWVLKELDDRAAAADPKYHKIYKPNKARRFTAAEAPAILPRGAQPACCGGGPSPVRCSECDTDALYVALSQVGLEQLQLVLLLLRSTWPGIPIAVVGNSMVRRSLSLVASNTLGDGVRFAPNAFGFPEGGELPRGAPLMALTHELIWASPAANAADLTQQFLRASTTFAQFYLSRGFVAPAAAPGEPPQGQIKVLAQGHAWVTVLSCVIFNAWFSARFDAPPPPEEGAGQGDGAAAGAGAAPEARGNAGSSRCALSHAAVQSTDPVLACAERDSSDRVSLLVLARLSFAAAPQLPSACRKNRPMGAPPALADRQGEDDGGVRRDGPQDADGHVRGQGRAPLPGPAGWDQAAARAPQCVPHARDPRARARWVQRALPALRQHG